MYGLPMNFSATFLNGRTLEQICFNQNQISLHFDSEVTITIESAFAHQQPESEEEVKLLEVPVLQSDLMQLLGRSVSRASGTDDGTLVLVFENGHTLKCFDTSREFESYQIRHGTSVIIV